MPVAGFIAIRLVDLCPDMPLHGAESPIEVANVGLREIVQVGGEDRTFVPWQGWEVSTVYRQEAGELTVIGDDRLRLKGVERLLDGIVTRVQVGNRADGPRRCRVGVQRVDRQKGEEEEEGKEMDED